MKLIIGLGNPEEKHQNTRHNVGFMTVDKLAVQLTYDEWSPDKKFNSLIINNPSVILLKPQTYMNLSGEAVSAVAGFYKIKAENVWVIHDDLDIPLGEYKIQKGRGPKLHYGIASIEDKLGNQDFWRVRIGVDNRDPGNRIPGEAYVLQEFSETENKKVGVVIQKVIDDIADRAVKK